MKAIGESEFMREIQRLHKAQVFAQSAEERQAANDDMAHLLRMNAAGRLDEYFASRKAEG